MKYFETLVDQTSNIKLTTGLAVGARASTIGKPNADMTIPAVKKLAMSFAAEFSDMNDSVYLLAI